MTKSEAQEIINNPNIPIHQFGCIRNIFGSPSAKFPEEEDGYRQGPCPGCDRTNLPAQAILFIITGVSLLAPRGPEMWTCNPLPK